MSTLKDLTIPDQGIRTVSAPSQYQLAFRRWQFFPSPSKKGQAKVTKEERSRAPTPADADIIDLAQLDEDDEDNAIDETDFLPDPGLRGSVKRKADHLLGPSCPICAATLGPSTSNQELNDHIDLCLNKDAISQASKRTPKKARPMPEPKAESKKGSEKVGGMMEWLRKG
jgi:DNA polymerase kappa